MIDARNLLNTDPLKAQIIAECYDMMRQNGAIPDAKALGAKYGVDLNTTTLRKWRNASWRKVYDKIEDTIDAMMVEMHCTAADQITTLLELLQDEPANSRHRNDLLKFIEYTTKLHGLNAPDQHTLAVTAAVGPTIEMHGVQAPEELNESGVN